MPEQKGNARPRAQIALEFVIVYSFILVIFVLIFTLISTQRAATMSEQEYSLLQLQAQNIADYINQALGAGSGYSAVIPIAGSIGVQQFNISMSTTGVVEAQTKVGTQIVRAYAFSNARNMVINGTQTQTGNGITVYLLSIQMGSISLTNSNGAVYVDMQPPSTTGLPKSVTFTNIANTKTANFGSGGSISVPITPLLQMQTFTVSMWVYITPGNPCLTNCDMFFISFGNSTNVYRFFMDKEGYSGQLQYAWRAELQPTGSGCCSTDVDGGGWVAGKWYHFVATVDSNADMLKVYMNGVFVGQSPFTGPIITSTITDLYIPWSASQSQMTNVQVYNSALTATQVSNLYLEGIGGAPILPANVVGWWPLEGNTNDYSGNNQNGVPSGVLAYQSVAQINAQVKAGTGANVVGAPMGIVASNGVLSSNGMVLSLYTNATGSNTIFISSNGVKKIANLTVNVFDDNITTANNLVGWWPLDEGYGSTAYDLSGYYNNGAFSNPAWVPFTNQTNLAVANFNGQSSTITANIPNVGTHALTVTTWIYVNSISASRYGFIDADGASGNNYDTFYLGTVNGNPTPYFAVAESAGTNWNWYSSPSTTLNLNTWYFLAGRFNGTYASLYVNANQPLITPVGSNGLGIPSTPTDIGWDACCGGMNLPGQMANIQLYNTSLTYSQITRLYQEGISGSPIGDTGLISWWPLAYSANDYSSKGNNGVPTSVTFSNVNYTNPATTSSAIKVASFNGVSSYIDVGNAVNLNLGDSFTIAAWVYINSVTPPSTYPRIVAKDYYSAPSVQGYGIEMIGGTTTPSFDVCNGAAQGSGGLSQVYFGNLNTGRWYFLVGTFNKPIQSTYVNGRFVGSTSYNYDLVNSAYDLQIGKSVWRPSDYFNGLISNVQIYNTALNSNQIMQLYQQGMPLYNKMNVSLG